MCMRVWERLLNLLWNVVIILIICPVPPLWCASWIALVHFKLSSLTQLISINFPPWRQDCQRQVKRPHGNSKKSYSLAKKSLRRQAATTVYSFICAICWNVGQGTWTCACNKLMATRLNKTESWLSFGRCVLQNKQVYKKSRTSPQTSNSRWKRQKVFLGEGVTALSCTIS